MKRAWLLVVAVMLTALPAQAGPGPAADGSDPKGDLVNPYTGVATPAPLAYNFPATDLRAWSLHATGSKLRATITTEGRWRDWVQNIAWGTVPSMMVLFRSPRVTAGLCPYCEPERGDRFRIGFMFRTSACTLAPPEVALVVWDPYVARPMVLASRVGYAISADERTITMETGYTHEGIQLAAAGDVLDEISAQTVSWVTQAASGGSICASAAAPEGTVDWAPATAWDPVARVHRTTGISIQA